MYTKIVYVALERICGNSLIKKTLNPIKAKLWWTSYFCFGDMVIGLSLVTDPF